jgi:hypothetical protein
MSTIDNAEHWRRRAAEMRAIAEGLSLIPLARDSILRIATSYERNAERAEERSRDPGPAAY